MIWRGAGPGTYHQDHDGIFKVATGFLAFYGLLDMQLNIVNAHVLDGCKEDQRRADDGVHIEAMSRPLHLMPYF